MRDIAIVNFLLFIFCVSINIKTNELKCINYVNELSAVYAVSIVQQSVVKVICVCVVAIVAYAAQ